MTQTFLFEPRPQTVKEKCCFKCGAKLPLEAFYAHPRMADGHLNKCKACARADVRLNRKKRQSYYRLYDAHRYREDPKRSQFRSEYALTSGGQEKLRTAKVRWAQKNRFKCRAHRLLNNALRSGGVQKPAACEACGVEVEDSRRLHAHHEDYDKPLEVEWLCSACHGLRHTRHKGAASGMSLHDLVDIQQLLDLGTEEAVADLWSRHRLTLESAADLVGEASYLRRDDER